MSDPVSALQGRSGGGFVRVQDAGPQGMITLRGDLSGNGFQAALKAATGCVVPDATKIAMGEDAKCLWMSPDELLLLVAYAEVGAVVANLEAELKEQHAMVADVSDARSLITLTGEDGAVRDVLAKLSPADLRQSACAVGTVRRTRFAQVPAAFWFEGAGEASVVCFRSVSEYVFGLLDTGAAAGSEPGFH